MNRQDAKSTKDREERIHPDDMDLGNGEWIRFVDTTDRQDGAAKLDRLIQPIEPFFRKLEVNCVAECCGVQAHSFYRRHVWDAVRYYGNDDLEQRLRSLKDFVWSLNCECVVSEIINQYFDRTVFIQLLDHLLSCVCELRRSTAPTV